MFGSDMRFLESAKADNAARSDELRKVARQNGFLVREPSRPMLSCSHWGMFEGLRPMAVYSGYAVTQCDQFWEQ